MSLTIKDIQIGNRNDYYTFLENEYEVRYNKVTRFISCTCYNGSNMGTNNVQTCKHKRLILKYRNKEE